MHTNRAFENVYIENINIEYLSMNNISVRKIQIMEICRKTYILAVFSNGARIRKKTRAFSRLIWHFFSQSILDFCESREIEYPLNIRFSETIQRFSSV